MEPHDGLRDYGWKPRDNDCFPAGEEGKCWVSWLAVFAVEEFI